jgi:hypothetical protein
MITGVVLLVTSLVTGQSPVSVSEKEAGHEDLPVPFAHSGEFALAEIDCGKKMN